MKENKNEEKDRQKNSKKNNSEQEVAEKWKVHKKDLTDEIEKAILTSQIKNDLLENIIEEEKIILDNIEEKNTNLITETLSNYTPKDREEKYDSNISKEKEDVKYDPNTSRQQEISYGEPILSLQKLKEKEEKDKKKDSLKFIDFNPTY